MQPFGLVGPGEPLPPVMPSFAGRWTSGSTLGLAGGGHGDDLILRQAVRLQIRGSGSTRQPLDERRLAATNRRTDA